MHRKPHNLGAGQGRNQIQNQRNPHIQGDTPLRNPQNYPVQATIMMQGQRPYMQQIPMQRAMRGATRPMYSSSPQGHSPLQGYLPPQQNIPFQMMGQEPFGQVIRSPAYISNVQQAYPVPANPTFSQGQYLPTQQHFYPGMQPMYYVQTNQPMPQQPQPPAATQNAAIQQNNLGKSKQKRSSKIIIRDPKDHKDVTDEILSKSGTANGRSSSTPPLANATAQTESSSDIQAKFAAQVAAVANDTGKGKQVIEKKAENIQNDTKEPPIKTTDQIAGKAEIDNQNKQENGSIVDDKNCTKDLPKLNTENPNQVTSLTNNERTENESNTSDKTHINQSSPTLGEMTEKLKMSIGPVKEAPSEQKVVLLRADRGAAKNGEKTTDNLAPESMAKEKAVTESMVNTSSVEIAKDENKDKCLDNTQDVKTSNISATQTDVLPGKDEKNVEGVTTSSEINVQSECEQEESVSDTKPVDVRSDEIPKEVPLQEPVSPQQEAKLESVKDTEKDGKLQEVVSQVEKPQEEDKMQGEGSEKSKEDKQPQAEKQTQAKQETPGPDEKPLQDNAPQVQNTVHADKADQKQDIPKQDNPKLLEKQLRTAEPPKKKSSKQRFKDINKKETGGDMMDAYTDKPPPQEPVVEEKLKPVEIIPEQTEKPLEEDLSWEDKEEKIGDEIKVEKETDIATPAVEQTKRKYERDFLLQFQFMQVCTEKPAGLPDIEVVLDAPIPPSKGGGPQRGGSDFLPSYARQKSQGGGGRRDSRGKPPPRKIITAAPAPPVVLRQSENRWQRPETKEKELSEEEKKTAELYRNVVAILNKLTPQKFKTLVEQISMLDIDTPERLEGVIDRIFEKAIGEPVFSVAYANMCRCLFAIKVADAEGKDVSFRKLLLNRCQKEFEKEKECEKALLEKNTQLAGLSEEERKKEKEEMDDALAKNKRRMLGNIKFIGELFKLKLLTENIMHDCIFKLLRAGDEESLESMCKLLFTIGKDLDSDKAKPRIEQYFDQINKIIAAKKVSSRVTFMLRDVIELRANKWVHRREEQYNPKTIDQIHKEAQEEKIKEQRLASQQALKDKQKKGGPGGRDSPKPTSNDGWITTGKSGKPMSIDQNKLRSMAAKRSNTDEISLGPSARFGQWGRGSSAGLSNSQQEQDQPQGNRFTALSGGGDGSSNRPYDPRRPSSGSRPSSAGSRGSDKSRAKSDRDRESALEAVRALTKPQNEKPTAAQPPPANKEKQENKVSKETNEAVREASEPVRQPSEPVKEPLSEEELAKKTTALIDEYVNIQDIKEAMTCFTDLHSPSLHHLFILTAVEHTYDMKSKARHDTGQLFAELLSQKKLSKEQLTAGFNSLLALAYDNAIDYPMLWKYFAEIITPVILGGLFTLSDLKPLMFEHLIPVGKAGVLFAEILLMIKEKVGESTTIEIWRVAEISWGDVLPKGSSRETFLSRKNLNFLPNESNEELLRLLRTDQLKNDTVFAHIEQNFKEEKRKESEFISQLVTAVAESCIVNKDPEAGPDCCQEKLKARKDILRKYLDNNNALELEALFALQEIYLKYNKPKTMLSKFFDTLYDEEVITEEAFLNWKQNEDPNRQEAKGPALQATSSFFEWLQAATVEGGEK